MPKPFAPPGTKPNWAPDRPLLLHHLRLDIEVDLERRSVVGRVNLALEVRAPEVSSVTLDAVEMKIGKAAVDGEEIAPIDYDGARLRLPLARSYKAGEKLSVEVEYRCSPRRGLYFLAPDDDDPARPLQCWTQGQDEDARHFVPCLDTPIEKGTTEVLCTAPAKTFVLSNGDLRERSVLEDGRTRWHYVLDFPQASYLLTLVCGTFVEIADRAPETGVEVLYFAPPGREEDTRRSLGRTPEMIDFFSRRIGIKYPHARYGQIVVADFIFGGMENTAATTLTDQALLDARAAIDFDVEPLVAHELAHQWWGDLLTCREWPHAWLNEGFATYFEYVWREHSRGRDEADLHLLAESDSYMAESGRYQRPIVCRHYHEPIEIFDSHLYEKGGCVLHMLRHEVGEETFWRALRLYAERHARGSVETRDLTRAFEEVSGRSLDAFFEDWVTSAGHPNLEASWEWDPDREVGTLRLEQKQGEERTYQLRAKVRFEVNGREHDETVVIRERTHTFELRLPDRPTQVIFDPGNVLLKSIRFDKPRALWVRQLEAARLGVDRVLAARALGDAPDPEAVAALGRALDEDDFWAVRAEAAAALGRTRRQDARDALLGAIDAAHPRVRRAVASALGEFRGDEKVAEALERWASEGDPSYFVEAHAALALGRTRSPRALATLPRLLDRPAFQDVIRARAIEGLAATADEAALPLVLGAYRPTASAQVRRAAIMAAGRLGEGTRDARRVRDFLEQALTDRDFRARMEAASALVAVGDGRAIPALDRALAAELDGRAKRRLREALRDLREEGAGAEKVRKLEDEMDRLRTETTRLRERLERLESRGGAPPPEGPPKPRARGTAKRPRPRSGRSGGTKAPPSRRRR